MTTKDAGITLLSNGHVELCLDEGNTVVWRRPKLGEYKMLRERITAAGQLVKADDGKVKTDDETEEKAYNSMIEFMQYAHDMLAVSGELPEDAEDWDIWLVMGQTQSVMFQHWQTVPLVRG